MLILVDDLGWNDISFYGGGLGNGAVQTPHIDSIARGGVHMSNGYAGNATCAPSRAALLTGRYPTRFGFEFTPAPEQLMRMSELVEQGQERPFETVLFTENLDRQPDYTDKHVDLDEIMLPRLLKQRDYHSIILGKWHLGEQAGQTPNDRGFDEFLGFLAGGSAYADFDDPEHVKSIQAFDPIDRFLWPNLQFAVRYNQGPRFTPSKYMTDYLSEQAVAAIAANRHRPFFMYLAYNAPHTPLHATRADYDTLPMIEKHSERVYGAMMLAVDRGVGQVLAALREHELEDNTLVIFTSDNGGAHYVGLPHLNRPYRGWKMTFFEGGIHTPYFLRWPGQISAGTQYDQPVSHIDIFSTAAAAATVSLPDDRVIDGVDLLPYITGRTDGSPHESLQWRSGGYAAALSEGWKIQVSKPPGRTWLFNMEVDPTEQNDLSVSLPTELARMRQVLAAGQQDWVAPAWPQSIATPIPVDKHLDQRLESSDEVIFWGN